MLPFLLFAGECLYLNAIDICEFDVPVNAICEVVPCVNLPWVCPGALYHREVAIVSKALHLKLEIVHILSVVEEKTCV